MFLSRENENLLRTKVNNTAYVIFLDESTLVIGRGSIRLSILVLKNGF